MSPKINHPNIGDVQKTAYLEGTILEVYATDEEDFAGEPEESRIDTADINIVLDDGNISGLKIPLYYHCSHDVEKRANGALKNASAAFSEDDKVIVQCEIISANHYKPLRVMGFIDKPKACGWIEDWEGETITSNHPWYSYRLDSIPGPDCCTGTEALEVISFEESNHLKVRVCDPGTGGNGCGVHFVVDLTELPEKVLNLGNFSEFTMDAYYKKIHCDNPSFSCDDFETDDEGLIHCPAGKHCDWHYNFRMLMSIGWQEIGGYIGYRNYGYYGFSLGRYCWRGDLAKTNFNISSYAELKAKQGTWETPQFMATYPYNDPIPWGDENYEIAQVNLFCFTRNRGGIGKTEMVMYFDNILIK